MTNDTLTLANGVKINTHTGRVADDYDDTAVDTTDDDDDSEVQQLVVAPTATEAQRIVINTRRKLLDLPAPPKEMNSIGVVLMYSLLGIEPFEISVATGFGIEQVESILSHPLVETTKAQLVSSIIDSIGDRVKEGFELAAVKAQKRVIRLVDHPDPVIAFNASRDVLDRSGFRPVDVVEHRKIEENVFRVEYVDKSEDKKIPMIDITPERKVSN